MNVPEALRATDRAVSKFQKAVAVASEELEVEIKKIHSQLLEEQPKVAEAEDRSRSYRED